MLLSLPVNILSLMLNYTWALAHHCEQEGRTRGRENASFPTAEHPVSLAELHLKL